MPVYNYKARDKSNNESVVSGSIAAQTIYEARKKLRNQNLQIIRIEASIDSGEVAEASKAQSGKFFSKDKNGNITIQLFGGMPSIKDLALFTKQFSLMIENGIPMLQALKLLQDQQTNIKFEEVIGLLHDSIESGSSLSDSVAGFPKIFDSLYVAMVKAGEASGRLDVILKQLIVYIVKAAKLKGQIKSAMAYPFMIVLVALLVITLLLVFVVPSFAEQFGQSGKELPVPTAVVIAVSNAMFDYWAEIIGTAVGAFFGLKYYFGTPYGRRVFDKYILRFPVIGDVMTKIAVSRFCSTMATMLGSGVSILEALDICASSSGNTVIEEFVNHVKDEISKGNNFADPLEESDLFPKMVASMVAVGESTGTLDATLGKVTEIYEEEVDNAISAMMAMIEPIMIVGIGGIVGCILIAMYLPIFDMASTM